MQTESDYWLAWSGCPDLGPVRFQHLLKHFTSAHQAWVASSEQLESIGIKNKWLYKINRYRSEFDFNKLKSKMEHMGISYICQLDQAYPSQLKNIDKAPIGLYVMQRHSRSNDMGNIREPSQGDGAEPIYKPSEDRNSGSNVDIFPSIPLLAVVGTRKITSYGRSVSVKLTQQLVDAGFGIVSGLMYGVDETAHRACIQATGFTIGVWAGGLDTLFRGSRQSLAEHILNSGGLLVSEFPIGMQPSAQTFPYRNRIVAGLSRGVLVTEGSDRSGTLITAGYGAEQGKEIFAVPGPITSQQSVAPAKLIKAGAKMVTVVEDILEEFSDVGMKTFSKEDTLEKFSDVGAPLVGARTSDSNIVGKRSFRVGTRPTPTDPTQQQIIDLLKNEPLSTDELSRRIKLPAHQIGSALGYMELQGWVKQSGDQWIV